MKKFLPLILFSYIAKADEPKDWYQSSPELVELGKNTFQSMCISCHGENGKAETPSGIAVKARNFTAPKSEWRFGTKVSSIFTTLTKGSPGTAMAPWESLPIKTRFAIAHYLRETFVVQENRDESSNVDFAKIAKEFSFDKIEKFEKIPFDAALKMMTVELPKSSPKNISVPSNLLSSHKLFQARCATCHGSSGEGYIANFSKLEVQSPENSILPFSKSQAWYGNFSKFVNVVGKGRPGTLKPPQGDLSQSQFDGLFQYVKLLTDN